LLKTGTESRLIAMPKQFDSGASNTRRFVTERDAVRKLGGD
jgi:hypothetical protein